MNSSITTVVRAGQLNFFFNMPGSLWKSTTFAKNKAMTLIRSISGIRGTIGGKAGDSLTPADVVRFTGAYAEFLRRNSPSKKLRVVLGRDARISGRMVSDLVSGTLQGCGIDVLDIGLTTTPTAEMAVTISGADGGIILTASHNPKEWNALKLLNARGEFLSASDGEELLKIADSGMVTYADVDNLGSYTQDGTFIARHIEKILELPLVDRAAIREADFSVAVDAVNSTGGIALPMLLKALGVKTIHALYCEPDGKFPHNPEPLPEHLADIFRLVREKKADVGFVVDPDVDRLAIITEKGEPFGEEYTLVAVADYILQNNPGNTVSNMSSSQALRDVTVKHGGKYFASAVGEVNVVEKMKEVGAVIGGEGNGGVILPELHYGRDALVGIALFLTAMAKCGKRVSEIREAFPLYYISKNKIEFAPGLDISGILDKLTGKYSDWEISTIDGVRLTAGNEWIHLRRSNTEPIIRIYAESDTVAKAENLAKRILTDFREILTDQR
jgi:phosphomannomutase